MRTIKLTIAATETHCEHNGTLCGFLKFTWPRPRCLAFTEGQEEPKRDMDHAGYLRLPECIAAEEALIKAAQPKQKKDAPTEAQKEGK